MKILLPTSTSLSVNRLNSPSVSNQGPALRSGTTKGFTLIELLVAIAILAILAVSGLVLFTGAQKNARDAKRRQDVDAIAIALETNKQATGAVTTYSALAANQFSGGSMPTDSASSKYCITTSATTGDPIAGITDWPATSDPCPTNWAEVNATNNGGGSARWTICALLENGTDRGAATPTYKTHCKSSSQ